MPYHAVIINEVHKVWFGHGYAVRAIGIGQEGKAQSIHVFVKYGVLLLLGTVCPKMLDTVFIQLVQRADDACFACIHAVVVRCCQQVKACVLHSVQKAVRRIEAGEGGIGAVGSAECQFQIAQDDIPPFKILLHILKIVHKVICPRCLVKGFVILIVVYHDIPDYRKCHCFHSW